MQSGEDLVCGLQASANPNPSPSPSPNPNPNPMQGPYGILAVTKPAELLVCLLGLRPRITTPNPNPLASPKPARTLTLP